MFLCIQRDTYFYFKRGIMPPKGDQALDGKGLNGARDVGTHRLCFEKVVSKGASWPLKDVCCSFRALRLVN